MSHFDVYGRMALDTAVPDIAQNGRLRAQEGAEDAVPQDIMRKLNLGANDVFLDIGCGLGLNLLPISKLVGRSHACDHPNVIEKLRVTQPDLQAELHGGNFLDLDFGCRFTRMLAYSVLPSLPDKDTVYQFVEKSLSLADPACVILLGDLANVDKKARFMNSQRGRKFLAEWEAMKSSVPEDIDMSRYQEDGDAGAVVMDDAFILDLLGFVRQKGFYAYVADQPQNLPFGNTREDLIIIGPEYEDGR